MTHTLHRRGTVEELSHDYVLMALTAQQYNKKHSGEKLKKLFEICLRHNPINMGTLSGNNFNSTPEAMHNNITDGGGLHAVFNNADDLAACLEEIKVADVGISIVVSGLFDRVKDCCHQAGIKPHTVNTSVGIFGKTELLPDQEVMKIHTMCGHGMISFNLIKHLADEVKNGRITARKAAEKMAANCHCGIFNPERAELLLQKLASR